jgi:hypothetical protein
MDGVPEMSKLKSVPVVLEIDRNEVRKVLEEAIEEKFEQVYLIGFKNKQAHLKSSKIDSNMEAIGALEMCKMQIFERSGQ